MRGAWWLVLWLAGCGEADAPVPQPFPCTDPPLDVAQRRRAEALTSLFENGTTELQYGYAEALDDGRGITAGRAGFTTATGDLLLVVERYAVDVPETDLAAFLPRLRELAEDEDDSVVGLEGLIEAWGDAAGDARFRGAQDEVVDELYYQPVLARAASLGVCQPLAVAILYDTIIQHGEGDDLDGLPALERRAAERAAGTPASGADQRFFMRVFLSVRREDLAHAYDEATREVWAESVGRCDVLAGLADGDNWDLHGPIVVDSGDYHGSID